MQQLKETAVMKHFSQPQADFSNNNNNERRTIMKRDILERHFDPEQIKQREGHFGKMLDYIEGHAVIQRLNDAFESSWSFSVQEHNVLEETGEILVLGQLSAGNIVKSQFGSSRITRNSQTNEMVSLASDLKAAATDSLKKCATLLGVGLHLYSGKNGNGEHQSNVTYGDFSNDNANSYSNGNGISNGNGQQYQNNGNGNGSNGTGRLSGKQYKYIMSLMSNQGRNKSEIDKHCVEAYGTSVQHLSRADASSLIKSMVAN
jgi:hypothetical protein